MHATYEILLALLGLGPAIGIVAWRLRRKAPEPPALPEPPKPPPPPPPPPAPPEPKPPPPPEPERLTQEELIELVITHISFSTKQVQVGEEPAGSVVVDYKEVISDIPTDHFNVRPMRDPSERESLLPSERTKTGDVALVRLLTSQSMVMEWTEAEPVMETVYRPVYRTLKHTVYTLLDLSGSMFGNDAWKIQIAKGVVLALMRRSRKEGADFLYRAFTEKVFALQAVRDDATQSTFERYLAQVGQSGGTAIQPAIQTAVDDCDQQQFDSCDIMIVTDGEDENINVAALRQLLNDKKMRLHAILLGTQNQGLRTLAGIYQEIPEDGIVRDPVVRTPSPA